MSDIEISVVLPCYNEQDNVIPLITEITNALKPLNKKYEIVCVNDGSTDDTYKILKQNKKEFPEIRIITFTQNNGLTAALDCGFKRAKGDIIIMCDADMQNDPADMPKLIKALESYDAAYGWRKNRQDTIKKRISSKIANNFRRMITKDKIHDVGCGLKAFKKECVSSIKLFDGLHRFIPILIELNGFTSTQIEVNHRHRFKGKSKYNVANRLFKSLYDLFAVKWMIRRHFTYKEKSDE